MSLLRMFLDLTTNEDLHDKLQADPIALIDAYHLSSEERALLMSGDRAAMDAQVHREVLAMLDTLHGRARTRATQPHARYWPTNLIRVEDVAPSAVGPGTVTLKITGRFADPARLELVRGNDTKVYANIKVNDPLTMGSWFEQAVAFDTGDAGEWAVVVRSEARPDVHGKWAESLRVG